MAHDLAATVRLYDQVWAERDIGRRRELLDSIWTDDSVYLDPDVPKGIVGPDALVEYIEASFEQYPGLAITPISEVAVLHDRATYRWRASSTDDPDVVGTDFIEFDADGRILRLTGFYDT